MAGAGAEAAATVRGLLGLGLLDAHQRGVAELVAAGLDGEERGERKVDVLEPAVFEFALHAEAGVGPLHLQDEGGVRDAEQLGEDDAGLAEAEVVGLQAGEDEVGLLLLDGVGEELGDAEGVASGQVFGGDLDVEGAVGALGEGLAQGAEDALRAGAEDDRPRRRPFP